MDAKKFIPCDSFMYLMWTAFLLYALDIFAKQRDLYGLEDSWAGFFSFLDIFQQSDDQVARWSIFDIFITIIPYYYY